MAPKEKKEKKAAAEPEQEVHMPRRRVRCACADFVALRPQSPYIINMMEKTGLNKKQLLKLLDQFKKIAADTKGKGKRSKTSINGGAMARN